MTLDDLVRLVKGRLPASMHVYVDQFVATNRGELEQKVEQKATIKHLLALAAPYRVYGPAFDRSIDASALWIEDASSGRAGGLASAIEELRTRLDSRGLTPFSDETERLIRDLESALRISTKFRSVKPAKALTERREAALRKVDGIRLSNVSNALIYDDKLRYWPHAEHKALLEAALAGHLRMYRMRGSLQSVEPSARGVGSDSDVHLLVMRP